MKAQRRPRRDPNQPLRVVIVTRLSQPKPRSQATGDARDVKVRRDEVSHETQESGCVRKAAALGGVVAAIFRDTHSGDRLDRDGLWRAVGLIRSGEADVLMTYAVDRLGRDQVQQAVIVYEVRKAGGQYLSATEDLAQGPLGEFMRSTYAFAAEMELAKTRERTNRALDARFAQVQRYKPAGRPPYGYSKVGVGTDATYAIDPVEAQVVCRIFRDAAGGVSRRKIAQGLNRDRIPSPKRGRWGITTVVTILARACYWTGQHEVWRSRTVRDAEGVPHREDRPDDERYTVPFAPLVGPDLAQLAHAAAERNVWKSRRDDRPAEIGIGRYGFFRCAGCGRALSVVSRKVGHDRYACGARANQRPCPSPASISVDLLDAPVWSWVKGVLSDPSGGAHYLVVRPPDDPDLTAVAELTAAEGAVADLTSRASALLDTLERLTGPAAAMATDRLNALNGDLTAATEKRDRLAAELGRMRAVTHVSPFVPLDLLGEAVQRAVKAMREAEPNAPEPYEMLEVPFRIDDSDEVGAHVAIVPGTWRAKQAALTALGVGVIVHQQADGVPRWVAEIRPSGGTTITGGPEKAYLHRTPRC